MPKPCHFTVATAFNTHDNAQYSSLQFALLQSWSNFPVYDLSSQWVLTNLCGTLGKQETRANCYTEKYLKKSKGIANGCQTSCLLNCKVASNPTMFNDQIRRSTDYCSLQRWVMYQTSHMANFLRNAISYSANSSNTLQIVAGFLQSLTSCFCRRQNCHELPPNLAQANLGTGGPKNWSFSQ